MTSLSGFRFVLLATALAVQAIPAHARLDISDRLPAQRDGGGPSTSTSSPGGGAGGQTGTATGANDGCGYDPAQCFGAVGMACQGALPIEAEAALVAAAGGVSPLAVAFAAASALETAYLGCAPDGSCVVNAGSWDHDECCASTSDGVFCTLEGTLHPGGPCQTSWDKAVHRTIHGLNWRRHLDQCRLDTDGRVDFADYCAPAGTIVASTDRTRCCGQRTRPFRLTTDLPKAVAQALVLDGSFRPRVCLGQAPATGGATPSGGNGGGSAGTVQGRPCTLTSQCGPGAICAAPGAGRSKVCLLI